MFLLPYVVSLFANLLPFVQVTFFLNLVFRLVIKLIKEVHSCNLFHLIYRTHIVVHVMMSGLICVDKAYGLCFFNRFAYSQDNFEKGIGNGNFPFANSLVLFGIEDWSSNNIYLVVFFSPFPACLFQIFPVMLIKIAILWTNVCH